jgi:cell division cycle 14
MSPTPSPAPAGRGALGDLGLELPEAVCIIADRFYWVGLQSESQRDALPANSDRVHFFSTDDDLVYHPFHSDFGPLNLSRIASYAKTVQAKLRDPSLDGRQIVHYCSPDSKKQTNAAWLACAFQVMALGRSPDDAYERFDGVLSRLLPFRDALDAPCTHECTVLDCLRGLQQAIQLGWFNVRRFNRDSYDYFTQVENGDMNWIVPFKFLAFASPSAASVDADGRPALTPEDYVPMFHDGGIRLVVRLNKKQYDRKLFINGGIKHVDLYFSDGSCPSPEIVNKFLCITENEPGAVAVHCTAGLGRSGTLIGLYAMKHYRFPARAFIGWCRTCRPGSILGRQQQFLLDMEKDMFQAGEAARRPRPPPSSGVDEALALQIQLMTIRSRDRGAYGDCEDVGQGDRLMSAKRQFQALGLQGVAATA